MKTILLTLTFCLSLAWSQSDCGNCWVAGQGCNYSEECILGGIPCAQCTWYVICDDPSCNYTIGPQCVCIARNLDRDKKCGSQKASIDSRNIILRQQAKNRALLGSA